MNIMAIFKPKKSLSLVPLLAFITMFLMLLNKVNSADSLSFTFNKFTTDQKDLILEGDATIGSSESVIQLTKLDNNGRPEHGSIGRASYYAPVHLWKSSQLVSSFVTTFTFSISTPDATPADGLAFFITSPDAKIPSTSGGEYLGLFPKPNSLKNSSFARRVTKINVEGASVSDVVVAVEFDTFHNGDIGDPNEKHIGIDINSITSKTTAAWVWQNGKTVTAQISYNSASKRLSVVASYPNTSPVVLYYDIDLFTVLPEWVRVGFSASTGGAVEANTLLSWSFTSTLQESNQIQQENMYSTIVM